MKQQPEQQAPPVQRLRVRYAKRGRMRFTSHRDFSRAFERAVFRARVPMAYSSGFNPHPRISYAGAAPTGSASEAEYLELALAEVVDPADVHAMLDEALPAGLDVLEVVESPGGSLADLLEASRWRIGLSADHAVVADAVARFLAADEVLVERMTKKGMREFDARGAVLSLVVTRPTTPRPDVRRSTWCCGTGPGRASRRRPARARRRRRPAEGEAPLMTRLAQGPLLGSARSATRWRIGHSATPVAVCDTRLVRRPDHRRDPSSRRRSRRSHQRSAPRMGGRHRTATRPQESVTATQGPGDRGGWRTGLPETHPRRGSPPQKLCVRADRPARAVGRRTGTVTVPEEHHMLSDDQNDQPERTEPEAGQPTEAAAPATPVVTRRTRKAPAKKAAAAPAAGRQRDRRPPATPTPRSCRRPPRAGAGQEGAGAQERREEDRRDPRARRCRRAAEAVPADEAPAPARKAAARKSPPPRRRPRRPRPSAPPRRRPPHPSRRPLTPTRPPRQPGPLRPPTPPPATPCCSRRPSSPRPPAAPARRPRPSRSRRPTPRSPPRRPSHRRRAPRTPRPLGEEVGREEVGGEEVRR